MNITQAEAIVTLYDELIRHLEALVFEAPEPTFRKDNKFKRQSISIANGQVLVEWSRYEGCGDYEYETTYHRLDDLFREHAQ